MVVYRIQLSPVIVGMGDGASQECGGTPAIHRVSKGNSDPLFPRGRGLHRSVLFLNLGHKICKSVHDLIMASMHSFKLHSGIMAATETGATPQAPAGRSRDTAPTHDNVHTITLDPASSGRIRS